MLGQTLGSYTLERELGRGGMGAVYTAVHTLLGRRAAVKVLLAELSRNQDLVQRFFNEARAATAIKHPSIVEIYDFGWAPDGSAFIVMELMEGESLATRLARHGRLPVAGAITIARQIANALAAAHRAGIVHRDLKPDNVFLVSDIEVVGGERVKLLDFGIAKLAPAGGAPSRTSTGAIMGTPLYMSPEQCEGARHVDHRTDLYALGCILFEMLAGRPPFQSEGVGGLIGAHLHLAPPALRALVPDAPAEIEAIIARLLAKAPGDRHASADEVAAALSQVTATSAQVAAAPSAAMTPSLAAMTPAPAAMTPSPALPAFAGHAPPPPPPTTLSGSSHALASAASSPPSVRRSRRGVWLALSSVAVAAAAAITVVAVKGSNKRDAAGTPPAIDAAVVAEIALDAADSADDGLAAMRAAVSQRDWAALRVGLDRVYDSTKDGDPRRQQADILIEETRPLILAVLTGEIQGHVARGRCSEGKQQADAAIKEWGEPLLPLRKLAATCKAAGRPGDAPAPIDAGAAAGGALAAMQAAVSKRDWRALRLALDQVYDSTTDADPLRREADALVAQHHELMVATSNNDVQAHVARGRCGEASRAAEAMIQDWGDPALPLRKLAAKCKAPARPVERPPPPRPTPGGY